MENQDKITSELQYREHMAEKASELVIHLMSTGKNFDESMDMALNAYPELTEDDINRKGAEIFENRFMPKIGAFFGIILAIVIFYTLL